MPQEIRIKICIFGNSSVGKTSIMLRIHQGIFNQTVTASIGIDTKSQCKIINGQKVIVQIWDTVGQQRYRSVVTNFSKYSNGFFLVFDATQEKSLTDLQYWIQKINQIVPQNVPKVLIANKIDLIQQLSSSQQQFIKKFCQKHKMSFYQVSAKSGKNIQQAYETLIYEAYKYKKYNSQNRSKIQPIVFSQSKLPGSGGSRCCQSI